MAWSYRQDRSDETYHAPGVHLVEGEKIPHTPASEQHGKEMLDPKLTEKREKEEEKFKEEQAKTTAPVVSEQERQQIRTEETQKLANEEKAKELDKVRKEEAENAKKTAADAKKDEKKENEKAGSHAHR